MQNILLQFWKTIIYSDVFLRIKMNKLHTQELWIVFFPPRSIKKIFFSTKNAFNILTHNLHLIIIRLLIHYSKSNYHTKVKRKISSWNYFDKTKIFSNSKTNTWSSDVMTLLTTRWQYSRRKNPCLNALSAWRPRHPARARKHKRVFY